MVVVMLLEVAIWDESTRQLAALLAVLDVSVGK